MVSENRWVEQDAQRSPKKLEYLASLRLEDDFDHEAPEEGSEVGIRKGWSREGEVFEGFRATSLCIHQAAKNKRKDPWLHPDNVS